MLDSEAFIDDCARADIIVTPLFAPASCGAELVVDRRKLETFGAVTLKLAEERIVMRTARAIDEDRPWSKKPALAVSARRASEGQSPSSVDDDARIDAWQNAPVDP